MIKKINKNAVRRRKHERVRKHLHGTAERPRFFVYRSLSHIYAQLIDDDQHCTLVTASTLDSEIREAAQKASKSEAAKLVGKLFADRARAKGYETVVFDRGGYLYHGRIVALADAAREAGLKF